MPEGTFLKIVDSAGGHTPLAVPLFPDGKKVPGGDQVITRIVHLDHVGADEMSSLLSKFVSKDFWSIDTHRY